ncbi:GAF domain-containing sensor histidine kinase [Actinoplanes sp. NPDC024001]|uniref:GAF domain-containing sensor histidine kinase n=1 Tax=Actinoplanes sp. NPDC024001 TaxID=3154598 RepID=UPI0033DBA6A0
MAEDARLAAVHSYHLLDAARPVVLDELTRLATSVLDTPMSTVTLIGKDRQWYAGNTGMPAGHDSLDVSFCSRVVGAGDLLVVEDTHAHPEYRGWNNVVGAPNIRFYAGAPLVDEDGHVLGTLCVLDDQPRTVGDRQRDLLTTLAGQAAGHLSAIRTRLLLAEVGDELSRAISREEDFVATVSHELRTPVTTIQGYLELLVDNEELLPYQKLIEPIQRNGERLVRMVDHLLAGTRPAGTPLPLLRASADLVTVAEAAVAACRPQASQRDVRVEITGDGTAPVPGDFTRLSQAAEHLVRNAVLFSAAGSPVNVHVTAGEMEITDTGAGIPADELPHVVKRFYRGRFAREQAVPGVGLGLSIADRIVRAHDGTLTVSSPGSGQGVTARMSLPDM